MPEIQHHDYETVHAVCDHCGSLCIFNRMADIGEPGPYGGRSVECFECGEKFWIWGDIINPAYELFIFAADEHFKAKRYMLYVGTLAQAWEIFLGTFAYSNYLYRSYFNEHPHLDVERFNQLSSQFSNAIQKFTFDPLRNLLINTVIKRVHPQTLDESESAIPRIVAEKRHPERTQTKAASRPSYPSPDGGKSRRAHLPGLIAAEKTPTTWREP
jgi:hypothetical protein